MGLQICLLAMCGAFADDVALNRDWAQQVFSEAPTPAAAPAHRLDILREDGVGDTKLRQCAAGGPLRLGDATYVHGIGVNSHSVLRVTLAVPAQRFLADIGLDRNVEGTVASVCFHVRTDEADLFVTDVMRPADGLRAIDVPLNGVTAFDLIVDVGGDERSFDQADWADARVILEDGTQLWLDELPMQTPQRQGLPFSFTYGGKPSTDFLDQWPRTVVDEQPDPTTLRRTLTLADPDTGLELRAVCAIYLDSPGVDWTLHFTNTGTQDTPFIENIRALDAHIVLDSIRDSVLLHSLRSSTAAADDWLPFTQSLPMNQDVALAPVHGRSSCGACPFFDVQLPNGGVTTGIGWTGQWAASVHHEGASVRLEAGLQTLRLKLRPGESIRTPRILQVYWQENDLDRAHNLFRRTMFNHVVPKIGGEPVTPPIAYLSTAFYEMDRGTEADVLAHVKGAEGLGFEYFWFDAYYGKDNFPTVGNYVLPLNRGLNLERFPRGLEPIGEAAHAAGMKFLWWVEPERICPGTLMATEHPDWVVLPPSGGWGMFNLGLPDAREYITNFMDTAIDAYRVDCLRVDNAVNFQEAWGLLDQADPDRTGLAEIRYIEGLYRMWDDLLAAHPGLFIDNCASGGQRIDLETCARSIPLWRTDATIGPLMNRDLDQAALQNQVMTAGLSRYVPFSTSGQMGADPYHFRSGCNAGIAFCEDCRPPDYPRDLLRQAIAEAKRLRKYYLGDLYPLSDVTTSPRDWCVLQYHRPDTGDGSVMAFRRHQSAYAAYQAALRGIDPAAAYEVTVSSAYAPAAPTVMTGADLQGLTLAIDDCPGSVVVEYRRTAP